METRVTIGERTDIFRSSPETLRSNVLLTLIQAGVSKDVRYAVSEQLGSCSNPQDFRFEKGTVRIEVGEARTLRMDLPLATEDVSSGDEKNYVA